MKYSDGTEIRLGDIVLDNQFSLGGQGAVVFSIDTDQYSEPYPKEKWEYLGKGIMVKFQDGGEIYYEGSEPYCGLELLERAAEIIK